MSGISAPPDPAPRTQLSAQPSLRRLIVRHKRLSLALLAALAVFVAVLVPEVVGSGSWKVTDASSCSAWSSANQAQQAIYVRLYVKEHGSLPSGATSGDSIETAINSGCTAAFAYDEADTVNVVQAIKGRY